jgi:hypothetical protein
MPEDEGLVKNDFSPVENDSKPAKMKIEGDFDVPRMVIFVILSGVLDREIDFPKTNPPVLIKKLPKH